MERTDAFPESYYIGQEFVEDTEFEECTIEFTFYSPAILDPFEFYIHTKKISGKQKGSLLKVSFQQKISSKLIDSLLWGRGGEKFIIGYISQYLPRINQELINQRYRSAHFLVRTFSTLDIYKLEINVPKYFPEIGLLKVRWPTSISTFQPAKVLAKNKDHVYLRDFIDAGNAYLEGNYDDSIRKVITSVENAFDFFKLKAAPSKYPKFISYFLPRVSTFREIILNNIDGQGIARKTISNNLIFLYSLRNKIVHNKFRIRPENGWVCKKAIGTLNYLYQFLNNDAETKDYVTYLGGQFLMLDDLVKGENLGYIKRRASIPYTEDQKIDSDEKLNNMMFSGLAIDKEEQTLVLRNKVPRLFYA